MAESIRGLRDLIIIVKGGGEMGSGVVHRLVRSGFKVCITEIPEPLAVRREVSFCEAVFTGRQKVEGLIGKRVNHAKEVPRAWEEGVVPVLVDPECSLRNVLKPEVLVDAILAKKSPTSQITDAPLVIGLGPGFCAGAHVHYVIETNRGHFLGRVIAEGEAEPDTGIPGVIGGYTWERVLRAPAGGKIQGKKKIGERVQKGDVIAEVEGKPVIALIDGVLRGILRDGVFVIDKMKVGDIDPRAAVQHCFTISEKARAIGGGVLEAILAKYNR
jgi:xanthine dehydrogenase accessory factor